MPRSGYSKSASGDEILRAIGYAAARDAAVKRAGLVLQAEWKELLNRPGSGKRYEAGVAFITTRGSPRRVVAVKGSPLHPSRSSPHTAAAPGEPPAKDRGLLAASVLVGDVRDGALRVGMGGPRGRIGKAQEYGVNTAGSQVGRHPAPGFRIPPHPHARPAADRARDKMGDAMRVTLAKGIKGTE